MPPLVQSPDFCRVYQHLPLLKEAFGQLPTALPYKPDTVRWPRSIYFHAWR